MCSSSAKPEVISTVFQRTSHAIPVVFIHGTDSYGDVMRAYVEAHIGSVSLPDCLFCYPNFETPYQFLLPEADVELISFLDEVGVGWGNGRILLIGFSGGAQFAHRFALKHPNLVHTAICLSAGCWTNPQGESYGMMVDEGWFSNHPWNDPAIPKTLQQKATDGFQNVNWVIGCGDADNVSRIESATRFFNDIQNDNAQFFSYSGEHDLPSGEDAQSFFEIICNQTNIAVKDQQELEKTNHKLQTITQS